MGTDRIKIVYGNFYEHEKVLFSINDKYLAPRKVHYDGHQLYVVISKRKIFWEDFEKTLDGWVAVVVK